MNTNMKQSWSIHKNIVVAGALVVGYFVWKADVLWNYFQFKQLCATAGGLKVHKKLQRGLGWEEVTFPSAQGAKYYSAIDGVGFVRFTRTKFDPFPDLEVGALIDVTYLGGPTAVEGSYSFRPADLSRPVVYQVSSKRVDPVPTQPRTNLISMTIIDAKTSNVLVTHNQFQFRWRTIPVWHWFGPGGTEGCPLSEGGEDRNRHPFTQSIFGI